jgi:hypothetical protein
MRSALMTAAGYQTQILEFIDMEHTPKNLLIRSVQRGLRSDRSVTDAAAKAMDEVTRLRSQLGVPPLTLERRLAEFGFLPESTVREQTIASSDESQVPANLTTTGGDDGRSESAS